MRSRTRKLNFLRPSRRTKFSRKWARATLRRRVLLAALACLQLPLIPLEELAAGEDEPPWPQDDGLLQHCLAAFARFWQVCKSLLGSPLDCAFLFPLLGLVAG